MSEYSFEKSRIYQKLDPSRRHFISIGHGNFVAIARIVAVVDASSLPMRRLKERAAQLNQLVDATAGRKTRACIVTDSGQVVLSAMSTQTLLERLDMDKRMHHAMMELREGEFIT